jgi:hypothetical protein
MFSTVDPRAVAEPHWAVILDRPPVVGLGHGSLDLEFATEDPEPISPHRRQGVDGMSRPLGYTEAARRCGHSAGIGVAQ